MFDKIIIGTANFVKPYGVLSNGIAIPKEQIYAILNYASENGIRTLDTAVGYGNIFLVTSNAILSQFNIITKFSVLNEGKIFLENLLDQGKASNLPIPYGVLIHDPQNIPLINKSKLKDFINYLRYDYGIRKIGVSVYDMKDIEQANLIFTPDIIQIPLNPFNQTFNNADFKAMVYKNKIEVHARSLFLQGVLLSDTLPEVLEPLKPFWLEFQNLLIAGGLPRLHALLQWAFRFDWIKSWVLGLSSVKDLGDIINFILQGKPDTYIEFQPVNHPLIDPRNWEQGCA